MARSLHRRLILRAALVTAVVLLTACGGDKGTLQAPSDGAGGSHSGGGPDGRPMFLEALDPLPLQVEATWSVPIRVRLQSNTYVPQSMDVVKFEIVNAPEGATLSAASSTTDELGHTKVDLRLGIAQGSAVVRATHLQATPLDIHVNIGPPTTGTFRVDMIDPPNAPVELPPYRVRVYDEATLDCAGYIPRQALAPPVAEGAVPQRESVYVSGIEPSRQFTIIGEAMGPNGLVLAHGCAQGHSVNPGFTELIDLQLAMVPISPTGTYDVESVWDMSEAIAGSGGAANALIRVIEFMADPGAAIYDIVIDEIEDAVGFGIDILLDIAGIKQRAIDYINDQVNRNTTAATFSAIAADLSTMLNELRVSSTLTISKTDSAYNFNGTEEWTSVDVSWTWRCEDQQSPDCATQTVDLTAAGGAAGAVRYDWTGSIGGYNMLQIASHQAQIDIGRLQLYLLEQVILPDITNGNAHSVGEAVAHWIDCDALANRALQGREICDPTGFFCAGPPEAARGCEAAIGWIGDWVTDQVAQLDTTVEIQLSGTATLIDATGDGRTNQIEDGVTTGQIAGSTEPVTVEWSATATE